MMRFDLREGPDAAAPDLYRAALDMAAWAEHHGCLAVALSEHHSAEGHLPSPLMMAAALAGRTESVPILVAAAILPLYDPVRLAEDLVVLDLVSGGRVSVVLGLGYRPEEFALYGLPFAERAALVEARLPVLLDALREGRVGDGTRSGRVRPRPSTPGGPPLAYGGASCAAARRAARFGLDLLAQTDREELREAYLAECAAVGREPGQITLPSPETSQATFVADDLDRAWDELGPCLLRDATTYAGWNGGDTTTVSLSAATTVEELRAERRSHRIVTEDEARELLREQGYLALHPLCGGIPPATAWPYLRRAAEVVAGS
ncbi:MAG: LLM class flavin-dependent oxidoreductase [Acidimicrobiia bacterium]